MRLAFVFHGSAVPTPGRLPNRRAGRGPSEIVHPSAGIAPARVRRGRPIGDLPTGGDRAARPGSAPPSRPGPNGTAGDPARPARFARPSARGRGGNSCRSGRKAVSFRQIARDSSRSPAGR